MRPGIDTGTGVTARSMKDLLYEVWRGEGRHDTLVARFRRREDAQLYIRRFGDDLNLRIRRDGETLAPPDTVAPRRHSDVVVAAAHPDEFIADQASNGDE